MSIDTSPLLLRGKQVTVRWWERRDDTAQRRWPEYTDPLSMLWNIPRNTSFYDNLFFATSTLSNSRRIWAIDNNDGKLIGRISLRDINQHRGQARLGISLGESYVSQGLGTEAMCLFLDYFFTELDFTIMVLDVAAFNVRAVRCYERLGFAIVAEEWRRSSCRSCVHIIERPEYTAVRPYFRRERSILQVLFLEMELGRDTWRTQRPLIADWLPDW